MANQATSDRKSQQGSSNRSDNPKPPTKLGAKKLTPEEQKRQFIDAEREASASENEADFDRAITRIVKRSASSR